MYIANSDRPEIYKACTLPTERPEIYKACLVCTSLVGNVHILYVHFWYISVGNKNCYHTNDNIVSSRATVVYTVGNNSLNET